MIKKINPNKDLYRYTEFMDSFSDHRHKSMLNNMRHHLKYECLQDPEIVNTIVPNPEYKFFGSFNNGVLRGMKEVKDFYYNMWNSHSSLIELEIHHCSPGDWGVACDGEWYQQVPGKALIEQGDKTVDPDKWYLSHAHLSWFFPFEDINGEMLLGGEICYIDETGSSLDELDSKDILTLEGARNSWPN